MVSAQAENLLFILRKMLLYWVDRTELRLDLNSTELEYLHNFKVNFVKCCCRILSAK